MLCASYKEYGQGKVKTIRADQFPAWKKHRSTSEPICRALVKELRDFDIFIAHNGLKFDRAIITSWALKYNLSQFMRFSKFIDPVQLSRKHLRLSRNSLAAVCSFLGIKQKKTDIEWDEWKQAAYDGNRRSMDYIVQHCEQDILVLEQAHMRMRKLVKDINDKGSFF